MISRIVQNSYRISNLLENINNLSIYKNKINKRNNELVKIQKRQYNEPISTNKDDIIKDKGEEELRIEKFSQNPYQINSLKKNFNINTFFPIQSKVQRPILEGKHVVGKSKTGTGKTLAFLQPLVNKIIDMNFNGSIQNSCMIQILQPTRELVNQVTKVLETLSPEQKVTPIYGGVSYTNQLNSLRKGSHIIVATPGRQIDLQNKEYINLLNVENLVIDETDEMLKMDFFDAINTILQKCINCKQIVYFSATVSPRIRSCIQKYSPNHIYIDCVKEMNATPNLIEHKMACLPDDNDIPIFILSLILNYSKDGRVMIFIDRKSDITSLVTNINNYAQNNSLKKYGCDFAAPLHGDISQYQREDILQKFRDGKLKALIATDVAARGIDIPEINLVIHIRVPERLESYIHRSGRTGRAGRKGVSILLYRKDQISDVQDLSRNVGITFSPIVSDDLVKNTIDINTIDKIVNILNSRKNLIETKMISYSDTTTTDDTNNITPFIAAKKIYDKLFTSVQLEPKIENIYKPYVLDLLERITIQENPIITTSFSLLYSKPNYTTIGFNRPYLTNTKIKDILSPILNNVPITINGIRSTNTCTLVDISDDIVEIIRNYLSDNTNTVQSSLIFIPTKLPYELFNINRKKNNTSPSSSYNKYPRDTSYNTKYSRDTSYNTKYPRDTSYNTKYSRDTSSRHTNERKQFQDDYFSSSKYIPRKEFQLKNDDMSPFSTKYVTSQ